MNKGARQSSLLALLQEQPDLTVQQMSQAMDVSQVTIRKDLKQLEDAGKLVRSYGKAILMQSITAAGNSCFIPPEAHADYLNKQRIGKLAASLAKDEDFVFIGPGYTCLEVAINLKDRQRMTIITTNVSAAIELAEVPECKLVVAPGEFTRRNGTYYVTGPSAAQYLSDTFFDKVFLTVDGISIERGFSVLDENTARIFHAIIKSDTQVIVCATSARFSKNAMTTLAPLTMASTIVTNARPDAAFMEYFAANGIEVLYP